MWYMHKSPANIRWEVVINVMHAMLNQGKKKKNRQFRLNEQNK